MNNIIDKLIFNPYLHTVLGVYWMLHLLMAETAWVKLVSLVMIGFCLSTVNNIRKRDNLLKELEHLQRARQVRDNLHCRLVNLREQLNEIERRNKDE